MWKVLSICLPNHRFLGLYGCELSVDCSWISTSCVYAEQQCLLVCFASPDFEKTLRTEAALCGCFLYELSHVSFLCVVWLCMNSNKTLAMCRRPAGFVWLSWFPEWNTSSANSCHLLGIPTSVSPDQNGYHWPVVNPYPLLSSSLEARGPHTRGFPIGHQESPHPITWPLTFCLTHWSVYSRKWGVSDSRLERQHTGALLDSLCAVYHCSCTKSCWNSICQVNYSFFQFNFQLLGICSTNCPEALDIFNLFVILDCYDETVAEGLLADTCLSKVAASFSKGKNESSHIMCCRSLESMEMKFSLVCPRNLNHKHTLLVTQWSSTGDALQEQQCRVHRCPELWCIVVALHVRLNTVQWICSAVQNLVISSIISTNIFSLYYICTVCQYPLLLFP